MLLLLLVVCSNRRRRLEKLTKQSSWQIGGVEKLLNCQRLASFCWAQLFFLSLSRSSLVLFSQRVLLLLFLAALFVRVRGVTRVQCTNIINTWACAHLLPTASRPELRPLLSNNHLFILRSRGRLPICCRCSARPGAEGGDGGGILNHFPAQNGRRAQVGR